MKIKDRPYEEDVVAMTDLAEVADWSKVAGPETGEPGYETIKAIVHRVTAATGWKPWPDDGPKANFEKLESWGFETSRGTTMIVSDGLVFADVRDSGWSAYDLTPEDIPAAAVGLDRNWPLHYELALRIWGQPIYASDYRNPDFVDEFGEGAGFDRRHLAVWLRAGAQIHLFSNMPTADPLSRSVGINYTVYLD
jgi:hypothetical protein